MRVGGSGPPPRKPGTSYVNPGLEDQMVRLKTNNIIKDYIYIEVLFLVEY